MSERSSRIISARTTFTNEITGMFTKSSARPDLGCPSNQVFTRPDPTVDNGVKSIRGSGCYKAIEKSNHNYRNFN